MGPRDMSTLGVEWGRSIYRRNAQIGTNCKANGS